MATPESKPRFWLVDREVEREPRRISPERPQQKLFERVASATANIAGLREKLGDAEQQIDDLQAKMEANWGPALLIAGMAIALVALSLWSAETHREMARLKVAGDASDLLIAKLRGELVSIRETIQTARQTLPAESSGWRTEQPDAALGSTIESDKITVRAQAETMRLGDDNLRLGNESFGTRGLVGGTRRDVEDGKAEDVMAAPKIEEILTTAEVLSGPVISKLSDLDKVSPDDLLLAPGHHIGREVVVTGSVMWLLRRYWLQSDSGGLRMVIDVAGLRWDDRNRLKNAVAQIDSLVEARARIRGTIEQRGSEDYRLAATQLVFVE